MSDTYKSMLPRSGKIVKQDGSIINEADYIDRLHTSLTGFDEAPVVIGKSQIDLKSVYPYSKLRDTITGVSGGAVNQNAGKFELTTDATATSSVIFESFEKGRYVAGFDALAGIAQANLVRPVGTQYIEWGYTDFADGFVVGEDAAGIYTAYYTGGVKKGKKYIADWGGSVESFDPSILNIYRLQFRYYGKGPFELKLLGYNEQNKGRVYFANSTKSEEGGNPITENSNLPISVKLDNNGTAGNPLQVNVAGRQFHILGDYNPNKRITSEFRIAQSLTTAFKPVLAVKKKAGIFDYIATKIQSMTVSPTGGDVILQVRILPDSLTGAVFLDPSFSDLGAESCLLYDKAATDVVGGLKVYEDIAISGQGNGSGMSSVDLPQLDLPSNGGIVVLCARAVSGTPSINSVFRIAEEW